MNGAFEDVASGTLESGRAAATVAGALPVGDEFTASGEEIDAAKAEADANIAGIAMAYTNKQKNK
jgi:hypothetical protein